MAVLVVQFVNRSGSPGKNPSNPSGRKPAGSGIGHPGQFANHFFGVNGEYITYGLYSLDQSYAARLKIGFPVPVPSNGPVNNKAICSDPASACAAEKRAQYLFAGVR